MPAQLSLFSQVTRVAAGLGLFVAGLVSLGGAERPKAENDIAIRMSPYEVSANSVDFKRWIKVSSPNYIVYTDANQKDATALIREFEMLHRASQTFFRRRMQNLPPTHIVLPTSNSDWKKIRSKGTVEWTAAVSQPARGFASLILVEYDWQNESPAMVRAIQGQGLIRAMNLDGPLWFFNGMGAFFETSEINGDSLMFGRQSVRTVSLKMEGWLSWQRFFEIDQRSEEFRKEWDVGRYFGQSAAFVQYLLANPDPVWTARLVEWAARMEAGQAPTEVEFKRVFGEDFKGWQKAMDAYHRTGKYNVTTVRVPPQTMNFVPIKIDLPVTEMRELFVLSQILNQRIKASEESLDALLARGLKTESLRELLAEACYQWKRMDAGGAQLRRLADGSTLNPAIYSTMAMELVSRGLPRVTSHSRLGAKEAEDAILLGRKALAIEPQHKIANEAVAWAEALGPRVDGAAVERIEKIYRVLVDQVSTSEVLSALAMARWRAGQTDAARALCDELLASPYAEKTAKGLAESLRAELRSPFKAP
ncbi:MAG: hypothetical protein V4773_04715 [Verrucomicrobiota bacterium]